MQTGDHADQADNADWADHADRADHADSADSADHADSADSADHADSAIFLFAFFLTLICIWLRCAHIFLTLLITWHNFTWLFTRLFRLMLPIATICMQSQAQVYRVHGDKPHAANDGKLTQHNRKL